MIKYEETSGNELMCVKPLAGSGHRIGCRSARGLWLSAVPAPGAVPVPAPSFPAGPGRGITRAMGNVVTEPFPSREAVRAGAKPDTRPFKLCSDFKPAGDQPQAIAELLEGLGEGARDQVLLGVTGSGKTFTAAHVIQEMGRPSLILAPNKTLAAQLYAEMKGFFPENAVEYFVSYYDYYQPEAYVPRSGHLHREGKLDQRADRPHAPRRHPRALRAQTTW